jgi:hypothetical protein
MVIDTSAILAILFDEPERRHFNELIEADGIRLIPMPWRRSPANPCSPRALISIKPTSSVASELPPPRGIQHTQVRHSRLDYV